MKITFAKPGLPSTGVVVVSAGTGSKLSASAVKLDKKSGGALSRAIRASNFEGKKGQSLNVMALAGTKLDEVMIVGLGKAGDITELEMQHLGGLIYAGTKQAKKGSVTVAVDEISDAKMTAAGIATEIAYGAQLRSYRFDKYKTKQKAVDKPSIKFLTLQCAGFANARKRYAALGKIADGVFMTRDLVSEPGNVIYPDTLAKQAKTLEKLGVKVQVLGEAQMKKLGMGALLGVGQGSARESKLVVMQWNGGPKGKGAGKGNAAQPIAFVGKGVTFDTGGISLKPRDGLDILKIDMGGSGAVIGLMKALAGRKAQVNVVGVIGCVENMPDGNAQRPGDIVTSMSGQTIEVIDTDAEGRLVLADALHYTNQRFKPKFMINLATLTGAIMVALAHHNAGLFSNNDRLAERLTQAGLEVDETLWRMPLGEAYDKMIDSKIADMKNLAGRLGGSITAAQFLQRHVDNTPWAHIDISGIWAETDTPTVPEGATGFGVRLLDRLVKNHYES
ncbi:MAG: leucyl aminopeptidase [Rhodospirillaceae bacterium]|jgi:leucyl aminopeptidase|nr:leucyl aminopeptidase [Rhodospirillaceae bacterium]